MNTQTQRRNGANLHASGDEPSPDTAATENQRLRAEITQLTERNSVVEAENRQLRSMVAKSQTTIMEQDAELAQWERGERTAVPTHDVVKAVARLKHDLGVVPLGIVPKRKRTTKRTRKHAQCQTARHEPRGNILIHFGLTPFKLDIDSRRIN